MIKLYKGDCLIESDKIESGSVDLILTDLPYGTITDLYENCKWDIVIDTNKIMQVANRILRKNGKMILFSQEPFTYELMSKKIPNLNFNQRLIWEKDSSGNMLYSKKACVGFYEDILCFNKIECYNAKHPLTHYAEKVIKYINKPMKDITNIVGRSRFLRVTDKDFKIMREDTFNKLNKIFNVDKMQGFKNFAELKEIDNDFKKKFASTFNLWEGKKYKSNVLKYKKDYDGHHPTQKPILLLEDLIKTFSNEGNLVVDLTMGSGSTLVACKNTNRNGIGIEMNDEYFKIAQQRVDSAVQLSALF
jgi:site-specific DNA-methyltransferase (adenine-specific)